MTIDQRGIRKVRLVNVIASVSVKKSF